MKHYPRFYNRTMLFLVGLICLALAALTLSAAFVPAVAERWQQFGENATTWWANVSKQSVVYGTDFSWMSIALIALGIIVALIAFATLFAQGGGRTSKLADPDRDESGQTIVSPAFLNALVKEKIADNPWIHSVNTRAFEDKRGNPRIRIDLSTFKGAELSEVVAVVREIVADLDTVLGQQIPTYVHIGSSWQTAIASRKRVK